MTGLRTDGRTDVRTYGHDVTTKFSELHGLLPFSLTNGAPQAAFGRWSSANTTVLVLVTILVCYIPTYVWVIAFLSISLKEKISSNVGHIVFSLTASLLVLN